MRFAGLKGRLSLSIRDNGGGFSGSAELAFDGAADGDASENAGFAFGFAFFLPNYFKWKTVTKQNYDDMKVWFVIILVDK